MSDFIGNEIISDDDEAKELLQDEFQQEELTKDEDKINPMSLTPSCKEAARIRLAEQVEEFIRRGGQVLELPPDTSSAGSLIF